MFGKKMLRRVICFVLCGALMLQTASVLATGETGTIQTTAYISDVKLIYANSLSDAKSRVPEGYILFEENVNRDTDALGVYLCYQTTTDADKAITDLRVMNENGGFDRGTFNDKMDQALKSLDGQAEGIYNAIVNEFVPNLKKELPGAKYAYEQLNIFLFADETPLGDYILDGKLTKQDISKMLLVCHSTVISSVLSLIAQGLQRPEGEDWLDKLETMDPAQYENNAALQKQYAPIINQIQGTLNDFSDMYNIMVYTDDVRDSMTAEQVDRFAEDLANEDTVNWWYSLWDILNAHPLAGDSGLTAESVLVEWYLGESVANHKICMLIDAMTEGQRALLSLVGPINLIFNDLFTEEMLESSREGLEELKNEMGKISLWAGVDADIFNAEVGITGVAYDEMVTADNYDIFTAENEVLTKTAEDYISLVTNYSTLVSSSFSVISGILMLTKGYQGTVVVFKAMAKAGMFLAKSLIGTIFTYAPLVVITLCLLATLIVYIVREIQADKPPEHDRTTIPKYMVDSVTDNSGAQRYEIYTRVDNVMTDSQIKKADMGISEVKNLSGADLNANKGYHWAALYYSKSESVGNPICADLICTDLVQNDDPHYIALRHFNKKSEAVDLNAVDSYNSTHDPVHILYRSERLSDDHTVYKYVRNLSLVSVSLRDPKNPDKYRFSAAEATAVAVKELTEMGMYPIDYNFSSDSESVTLIGWNGTDNPEYALKDVRWVYKSSVGRAGSGRYGSLSYGNLGTVDDWSLFVCRGSQSPAPPITALRLMKYGESPSEGTGISVNSQAGESTLDPDGVTDFGIGWEPVNEFAGGHSVPMGKVDAQLYFLPETVYTEGPDYLAGVKTDTYLVNREHSGSHKDCSHEDIWNNDFETYKVYKSETFGEYFFEGAMVYRESDLESASSLSNSNHGYCLAKPDCPYMELSGEERMLPLCTLSVKYYLTKNPYRAVYGLASRTSANNEMRSSFLNYDGYGYTICPVEITSSMARVLLAASEQEELLERGDAVVGKSHLIADNKYHSAGITVNVDFTQSITDLSNTKWNSLYISGYSADKQPLTAEDIVFSADTPAEGSCPEGFTELAYIGGDGTQYATLAPVTGGIRVSYDGFSSIKVRMYNDLFAYVRSEVTRGEVTTTYKPGQGKYISNLMLVSKEKIRTTSLLYSDKEAECKNISYTQLEAQLVNMGATTTIMTNVGTDYYSGGNDNANTVYMGYSRTDDPAMAIRDIRFYVCQKGEKPEDTMEVTLMVDGKKQTVTYTLVDGVSITSKANLDCDKKINGKGIEVWEETELLKERQAYVYITRNATAFPDPITDIIAESWFDFGTYEPICDFEDRSIYSAKKDGSVNLHVKNKWFEEGSTICFKRESNKDRYIGEMVVSNGDDRNQTVADLVEAGYSVIDQDLNEKAAGDHIYIGVKYTDDASEAIRNLMTVHNKKNFAAYSLTDEGHVYIPVSDVDLNKGALGDYIYLYYTTDARAGEPLVDLKGSSNVVNNADSLYSYSTVGRIWDMEPSNLNAGTSFFTADIYLIMQREVSAGAYISEVDVVYAWSRDGAIEKLADKGFTEFVDKDLNDGTGSSQYIYLGYKRTDDPSKAIRNLITSHRSEESIEFEGITYYRVSTVNLNRHCLDFSADIYLYYTMDPEAGDPIKDLYTSSKPVDRKKDSRGYHYTVRSSTLGSNDAHGYAELNQWAGGDYIYMVMISSPEASLLSTMFGNGSWLVVLLFAAIILLCVAGALVYRRRRESIQDVLKRLKAKLSRDNGAS